MRYFQGFLYRMPTEDARKFRGNRIRKTERLFGINLKDAKTRMTVFPAFDAA